ncbi:MAG: hypothetical protein H5U40_02200 [Polyangiaceae bacterium]|nr:hypothetical protein [Polyangiaceae bacterium]
MYRAALVSFLVATTAGCASESSEPLAEASSPPRPEALATRTVAEPSAEAPPPEQTQSGGFLGESDELRRRSLESEPIASVEKGSGGRSLGFKITLRDGTRGYFKPEQSFSAAHWWSEVAAYYVDRELGFGRVPPLVGRRFGWKELRAAAGDDRRVRELAIAADGTVRGAFIGWVDGGLEPLGLPREWERWVRVRAGLGTTPYQRPAEYRAMLGGSRDEGLEALDPRRRRAEASPEPAERAAELSDLIVFDYLIQNVDRWGGGFTNVRTRGANGPLVFLDNGAGFWPDPRLPLMEARLRHLERFRRGTVEALERFDLARLEARIARDPLAPVLSAKQLGDLGGRVEALRAHIGAMRAQHGERIFFE